MYGPWGRPDMALFLFTKSILERKPIQIFNNGQMIRDFTYIDDIIESIVRLLDRPASPDEEFNTLILDHPPAGHPIGFLISETVTHSANGLYPPWKILLA